MGELGRRDFLKLLAGGAAFYLLAGCFRKAGRPTVAGSPTVVGGPTAAGRATAVVTATPTTPAVLRNENRPSFYIRYFRPFTPPSIGEWRLKVEGLVKNSVELDFDDLKGLPFVEQASRLKCVECWSAAAKWGGFRFASLMELVKPSPKVKWVHFYCADGYYESLRLEEALHERTLLCYRMNEGLLPPEYGGPLRVLIPSKYGYKSPKLIIRMEFAEEELVGYWPSVGPYSADGDILPGLDHPLDLKGPRKIPGGEVVYPDGLESRSD